LEKDPTDFEKGKKERIAFPVGICLIAKESVRKLCLLYMLALPSSA
jgi:hypothetical protein